MCVLFFVLLHLVWWEAGGDSYGHPCRPRFSHSLCRLQSKRTSLQGLATRLLCCAPPPAAQMPLRCTQPVSPCNSVAALHSDCAKAVVMPSDYPTEAFKVGMRGGFASTNGDCTLRRKPASSASKQAENCIIMHSSLPLTPRLQADYGVLWERINWLNPTIPFNATTIPKGTTVCVKNGAPPPDVPLLPEPGGSSLGLKQLALASSSLYECEHGLSV